MPLIGAFYTMPTGGEGGIVKGTAAANEAAGPLTRVRYRRKGGSSPFPRKLLLIVFQVNVSQIIVVVKISPGQYPSL